MTSSMKVSQAEANAYTHTHTHTDAHNGAQIINNSTMIFTTFHKIDAKIFIKNFNTDTQIIDNVNMNLDLTAVATRFIPTG